MYGMKIDTFNNIAPYNPVRYSPKNTIDTVRVSNIIDEILVSINPTNYVDTQTLPLKCGHPILCGPYMPSVHTSCWTPDNLGKKALDHHVNLEERWHMDPMPAYMYPVESGVSF